MRQPDQPARAALWAVLRKAPASAPELAQACGLSARTVLRILQEQPEADVAGGKAGRRRYATRRALRGDLRPLPLYAIDAQAKVTELGSLNLLQPQGSFCTLAPAWPAADGAREGWWDGLPYPLYDMRPQGYLGRQLARHAAEALEVAPNPADWDDDTIALVLSRRGPDTAGNLVLGEASLRLHQAGLLEPEAPIAATDLPNHYAQRATQASGQGLAASSAAGEFPKFTALREATGPGTATPHVIVKFSGVTDNPATQRWSDLLVCEQLALDEARRMPGTHAARSRIVQVHGRTFLESERFDRIGRHGRRALVSLQSASAHLLGLATHDWPAHAQALQRAGWLAEPDAVAMTRLWWFGRLIANTDMHLGNAGLFVDGGRFTLAPAYDMLPMAYAPLPGGELPAVSWRPPLPLPPQAAIWHQAASAAMAFWREAARDHRISQGLRTLCVEHAAQLERAAQAV